MHNETYLTTKGLDVVLLNFYTVYQDLALLDVVKAKKQVGDCRLATARGANKGDLESGWNLHVEVVKHDLITRRVFEGNIFENDFSLFDLLNT